MKTYAELFNEIQISPYGDEMFQLQKECAELNYMEAYIENQLYIRENFKEPNDLLVESLDEDRLQRLITEAEDKSESWFIKIKNVIVSFFSRILQWISKFFSWLTSSAQVKERELTVNTILEAAKEHLGESVHFDDDQSYYNEDKEIVYMGDDDKRLKETYKTGFFGSIISFFTTNYVKEFEKLEKTSPMSLSVLKNGKNNEITMDKIKDLVEYRSDVRNYPSWANVLAAVVNFKDITYIFKPKTDGVYFVNIDEFVKIFDMLNGIKAEANTITKGFFMRMITGGDELTKIDQLLENHFRETSYQFTISSIDKFEKLIKQLQKVLVAIKVGDNTGKFDYRATKTPRLLFPGRGNAENEYKLDGITDRMGHAIVRDTGNKDEHFRVNIEHNRVRALKFYNKFSKASANLLKAMQLSQKLSDIVIKSVKGVKQDSSVANKLTK